MSQLAEGFRDGCGRACIDPGNLFLAKLDSESTKKGFTGESICLVGQDYPNDRIEFDGRETGPGWLAPDIVVGTVSKPENEISDAELSLTLTIQEEVLKI